MKKLLSLTILAMIISLASFAQKPIYGTTSVCIGSTETLYDTTLGGTWSSTNTSVAVINPTTGVYTGITAGTSVITYTALPSYVITTITVSPAPAAISGISWLCTGSSFTFSDATSGGTWSTSSSYIASVSGSLVTANHSGIANIYYTVGGCSAVYSMTVAPTPVISLKGSSSVCTGSSITITDSSGYTVGTWSSSNISVATVSGGVVTGIANGTATISFSVSGACGTVTGTKVITVTSTTSPGTISGPSTITATTSATLFNSVAGGVWSSSDLSVATIGSGSGVYYGVAAGTATISYTVTGCSGPAYATYVVTITAYDGISGHVKFMSGSYYGLVKVWLITYDPTTLDLQAYDSTTVYGYDTEAYYSFAGVRTDSFRIKASVDTPSVTGFGYIPTYHTSSFYWYSANVLPHTSGTSDINQDIIMAYGAVVSGPGFIGGSVTTGANKGTGVGYAKGLVVYLLDATGNIVKQTKTDASGNYSFSALPLGTYQVFPEAINYLTTAYTSIALTSSAMSMTGASFIQHTLSHTITPGSPLLAPVAQASVSSVIAFPNPSNGKLNIQWNEIAAENGTVIITDITGREVYKTAIDMTVGTGVKQLDLSGLTNGMYMININSASVSYNNKIQLAK